jgi:cell fate regulator YaaT (PSP1 superfamily)
MAKEQGLPLNPTKISGVCGRLMCCLSYENDNYIQAKQQMPHIGTMLETPSGTGKVVAINVPQNSVEVMLESGVTIHVPVETQEQRSSEASCCSTKNSSNGSKNGGGGCGSCSFKKKDKS